MNYEVTLYDGSILQIEANDPLEAKLKAESDRGLGAPYLPMSDACYVLNVSLPDSMEFETFSALSRVKDYAGGDLTDFVRKKLKYKSKAALCKALAAEQIDGVAMAIYNVEKGMGMIIGDQTGIGKGRQAAGMIRYAAVNGLPATFLSEKANLFSDMFRDLQDIGSGDLKPFIINAREGKTNVKDKNGKIIHKAPEKSVQEKVFKNGILPKGYDFVMGTYSQFSIESIKRAFLANVSEGGLLILDEAHNASGSGATGVFMRKIVSKTKGTIFLSATFAKRPDNMPLYAAKTAMSQANMTSDDLVNAIAQGGHALQEVISSQLVSEGQLLRRERGYEGVEVNYLNMTKDSMVHRAAADSLTDIMRDIVQFQENYITPLISELDEASKSMMSDVSVRKGTEKAGVNNSPYFSRLFLIIHQMLFSLKARSVASQTISRLREGKKVIVAFGSTMESFLEAYETGKTIGTDFSEVLSRGLHSVMKYTEKDFQGKTIYSEFSLAEIGVEGTLIYHEIQEKIKRASSGLSISPLDMVRQLIEQEGYKTEEVTGRKRKIHYNSSFTSGIIEPLKKHSATDAFRMFNDNEVDVLLINQSGSTGASAHAVATPKVPENQVKQRVMVVLQAELDINTEIQKRGRINRTGQIKKPIYDYVISDIPAENRLMMMLRSKLKSLDANTTSNQKTSEAILNTSDFLNKYGDKVVSEWLKENLSVAQTLGFSGTTIVQEDAARKVSGRVAILPTKIQQKFYKEIGEAYEDLVTYLKQSGEYDLEMENQDLQSKLLQRHVVRGGSNQSAFGGDTYLEKLEVNNLRKPFKQTEVQAMLTAELSGKTKEAHTQELMDAYRQFMDEQLVIDQQRIEQKYAQQGKNYTDNPLYKKLIKENDSNKALELFSGQLNQSRTTELKIAAEKNEVQRGFYGNFFSGFYPGRAIQHPISDFEGGLVLVKGIFIGFDIDRNQDKPFLPSKVKAKMVFASSERFMRIPLSGDFQKILSEISQASASLNRYRSASMANIQDETFLKDWDLLAAGASASRIQRYVMTGNLLQGFAEAKGGKLIDFTTIGGEVRKGILMSASFKPDSGASNFVQAPIGIVHEIIEKLEMDQKMSMGNYHGFFHRKDQGMLFSVPLSKKRGARFYQDADLLDLAVNNNFESNADQMRAFVAMKDLKAFLEVLGRNHKATVKVSSVQYDNIKEKLPATQEPEQDNTKDKKLALALVKMKVGKAKLKLIEINLRLTA